MSGIRERGRFGAKPGGACVFRVRGYADPAGVIQDALKAGQQLGIITPNGLDANGVQLYMRGSQAFDPADTKTLIKLVTEGVFEKATDVNGMPLSPNQNYKAALIKSKERAEGVKAALLKYAERKKKQIAENQFLPSGEGIADPVVPYPKTDADQQSNMRVVFELIQFSGEKAVAPGK